MQNQSSKKTPTKPSHTRRYTGFQSLSKILPTIVKPAFSGQLHHLAQLALNWKDIVGPDIDANIHPVKLLSGVLTLHCYGPIALIIQHSSSDIIYKINLFLGKSVVTRLRFIQTTPPINNEKKPTLSVVMPTVYVDIPKIADGPLKEALQRLGQYIRGTPGK